MIRIILLLPLFLTGCVVTGKKIKVDGLGDELESQVRVSTYNYNSPLVIVGDSQDWFLRGFINKESKHVSYQLYVIVNSGRQWVNWNKAKFKMYGKIEEHEIKKVNSDVKCSQYGCIHYEDVILNVNRKTMNEWQSGNTTVRISSSKVTGHRDIEIDPKEVIEFLNKMDFVVSGGKR